MAEDESSAVASPEQHAPVVLPRVVIKFCTQCRWMLRAAYFAQELLSTFGTTIGEIALQPTTGGIFQVYLEYSPTSSTLGESPAASEPTDLNRVRLWDRKTEGGFPETKVLKQLVRDHLEPSRDLGHSDRGGKNKTAVDMSSQKEQSATQDARAQAGGVAGNEDAVLAVGTGGDLTTEARDQQEVQGTRSDVEKQEKVAGGVAGNQDAVLAVGTGGYLKDGNCEDCN